MGGGIYEWAVYKKKLISTAVYLALQGWGAGARAGCFGSLELEPEPLEKKPGAEARAAWKKSGAGAGGAKKLADSSALLEDKKHKEIVCLLLFFR